MPDVLNETERLPDYYARGFVGGLKWNTEVVRTQAGKMKRNQNQESPLGSWDFAYNTMPVDKMTALRDFFHAVAQGRANGFRMRDPMDNACTIDRGIVAPGRVPVIGGGDAMHSVLRIFKRYLRGSTVFDRRIWKPLVDATLYRGATPVDVGAFYPDAALGQFVPSGGGAYVGDIQTGATITQVAPFVQVHLVAHGFTQNDLVTLIGSNYAGFSDFANILGPDDFQMLNVHPAEPVDGAFSVGRYATGAEPLSWSGHYDVPVLFNTDYFNPTASGKDAAGNLLQSWQNVGVDELPPPGDEDSGE